MTPRSRRFSALLGAFAVALAGVFVAAPAQALAPTNPDSQMWGVNGRVRAIVETPDAIYIGGSFTAVVSPSGQTLARRNLAALDPKTGQPLDFAPQLNRIVLDLALSPDGSTLWAGGTFSKVGSVNRGRAAAWNTGTGSLLPYDVKADAGVEAITVSGNTVYLGGAFTALGSVQRSRIAATDFSGTVRGGFNPGADDVVHDMVVQPGTDNLVVGGLFSSLGGQTQARRMALVRMSDGAVTAMADKVPYEVFGVEATPTQIFWAGAGGGGHVHAYDATTRRQQWLTLSNGDAHSVTYQNGVLYVGGHFTAVSGRSASHVAALNPATGEVLNYPIKVNSNLGVFITTTHNGHLSIGGDFTKINNRARSHYARFTEAVDSQAPSVPGRPSASATGATTARVTWPAARDNTATNILYSIYRDGGSLAVGRVSSSSTGTVTFDDGGMDPGSTHTWRVSASDGTNSSGLSPTSDALKLPDPGYAVLTALGAFDSDDNGKFDRVVATFSDAVSCVAPCRSMWNLADVPSGGTLRSVSVSGNKAVIDLSEGAGKANTAVGVFTVTLSASASGVVDAQGRQSRFSASPVTDNAGPVPTDITSTNGAHNNVMEPGDTFTVTFSEPIDPSSVHAANVKESDQNGAGNDTLIIVGLTDSAMDLGSNDYVTAPGGTIVFADATLTLLSNNTKLRSTIVGSCSGSACGATGAPADARVTFRPEPVLSDLAGNGAVGSHTESEGVY